MCSALDKLVQIGGDPLGVRTDYALLSRVFGEPSGLEDLFHKKNGFYAFGSALRVFPMMSNGEEVGLIEWNSADLWKSSYAPDMVSNTLFFAEDVFGGQFCIRNGEFYSFDPETAEYQFLAEDLEGWAAGILADFNYLTGYEVALVWQHQHYTIPAGKRLVPKLPFILGGDYVVENLVAVNQAESMRFRGNLACQIHELPDGAKVDIKITE